VRGDHRQEVVLSTGTDREREVEGGKKPAKRACCEGGTLYVFLREFDRAARFCGNAILPLVAT